MLHAMYTLNTVGLFLVLERLNMILKKDFGVDAFHGQNIVELLHGR